MIKILKSSRHRKTIGKYGEWLITNYLSRANFEVSIVDHTGIDIIAYSKDLDKRLGISVKSRTREEGKENDSIQVLKNHRDVDKLFKACEYFACEAWIGVYSESKTEADMYLCPYEHYKDHYHLNPEYSMSKMPCNWGMSKKAKDLYQKDEKIIHVRFRIEIKNWFKF